MKKVQESVYVTYIYPITFIVHENEKIDFSIEDINSLSYDHSLLHRIIGTVTNHFDNKDVKYIVCGDGALGMNTEEGILEGEMIGHYNDLLCKMFLGGIRVEAISNRDIVKGNIYKSKSIWPVGFGESWNSHIHAELRMRLVGVTDAILLYQPKGRTLTIEEIIKKIDEGNKIVKAIPNLSTFHLLNGITEFKHQSWSASLTYLWVVVEEITDYLWLQNIIDKVTGENTKKRKEALKDTRTYTMAVKQEVLLQIGVLNERLYNNIFEIRQMRNKLIHEGKMIPESKATLLYESVKELLILVTGIKIEKW